jgi:bifunctional UDP-N-acetylglucosamine pyrophosphorylase/glucosamine-1-phosphate N-acetyltransferase
LGKPILQHATDACTHAGIKDITVVISPGVGSAVREALPEGLQYAVQDIPKGTGHAVMAARAGIKPEDDVLILYGDMPLFTTDFIRGLTAFYEQAASDGVVTGVYSESWSDFGRIFTGPDDMLEKIVEVKDLVPGEPVPNIINPGVYVFKGEALLYGLDRITTNNKQGEYYLTDVPEILRRASRPVKMYRTDEDAATFIGINNQAQLAEAATYMRVRLNKSLMESGVRMLDPATTYIDVTAEVAPGVTIYPGSILEGTCRVASGAVIGPDTHLVNADVGMDAVVRNSVVLDSSVGSHTEVGPFAYLRPGSAVGNHCKVGNFVEVKNAVVGDHTKASHLAYIGDAEVGSHLAAARLLSTMTARASTAPSSATMYLLAAIPT